MSVRSSVLVAILLLGACSGRPDPAPVIQGAPAGPEGIPAITGPGGSDRIGGGPLGPVRPGSQHELAAAAGDRLLFAYDSSDISPEGQQTLLRQSAWLKRYPNITVLIEGHADERGTREYNLSLGERRAEAVKNALIALGITPSRISTISYGKERPEIPHSDDASYAQNRRAVTVVN
jgi:peptidoglycan-associated lipoprotein